MDWVGVGEDGGVGAGVGCLKIIFFLGFYEDIYIRGWGLIVELEVNIELLGNGKIE